MNIFTVDKDFYFNQIAMKKFKTKMYNIYETVKWNRNTISVVNCQNFNSAQFNIN